MKTNNSLSIWTYWLWSEMVCTKEFHDFDFKWYTIPEQYASHKEAFLHAMNNGMTMFDASLVYGNGEWVAFLWECLKDVSLDRDKYKIVAKLEKIDSREDIEKELDLYLTGLWVEYIDVLLLHSNWSSTLDLWETHHLMSKLIGKKVKWLWASNFSLRQTKYVQEKVGIQLEYFEWLFNLDCKHNQEVWIVDYCKENNIAFTSYQALRRNNITWTSDLVASLAHKYSKTENQIMLNRMTKSVWINALIRSSKIHHIDENIASQSFDMEAGDYQALDEYRNAKYMDQKIDRERTGDWVRIAYVASL